MLRLDLIEVQERLVDDLHPLSRRQALRLKDPQMLLLQELALLVSARDLRVGLDNLQSVLCREDVYSSGCQVLLIDVQGTDEFLQVWQILKDVLDKLVAR